MTGKQLRLKRVGVDVKVFEVAERMGVVASRVSQIEALAIVTPDTVARYEAALAACLVSKSPQAIAQ